jgi:hypothetical protein
MAIHKLPVYPKDHPVGSVVAEGGSMCANCEYLRAGGHCAQKLFVSWNGSNKIPAPIKNYCCDFWEVNPRVLDVKLEDVGL